MNKIEREFRTVNTIMANKGYIIAEGFNKPSKESEAATFAFLKNVESLGFTFEKKLINSMFTMSVEEITNLYNEVIPVFKHLVGADETYTPMYPNFPNQVWEITNAELLINAFVHYVSSGELVPIYQKDERFPLLDNPKLTTLSLKTKNDFHKIIVNTICSTVSVTERDKADIIWFFENCDYSKFLPREIPFKENAILVSTCMLNNKATSEEISKYIKTPTDVLRLAIGLSDGDISLVNNTKFRNFTKRETNMLLALFEKNANPYEMAIRSKKFIRLGEKLHPGTKQNKKKYPLTADAFYKIRNKEVRSFAGYIEMALNNNDYKTAVNMLTTKESGNWSAYNPGDLGARLDKILRIAPNEEDKFFIIDAFESVAENISVPMLARIMTHFEFRNSYNERAFLPKGNIAKTFLVKDTRDSISQKYCDGIVTVCYNALIKKFESKKSVGNVFVSDNIKGYSIPTSSRAASDSFRTLGRGTRINLTDENFITAFIHWNNVLENGKEERIDVDLSATFLDENWVNIDNISYRNLKNNYAVHSGDFVSGKTKTGGASEFICIDKSKLPSDIRYIVIQVYSYSEQPFSDMTTALVGFEYRNTKTGEAYEPSLVRHKIDLSGNTLANIPFIFDMAKNKFIWADLALNTEALIGGNNVENNMKGVTASCRAITIKDTISLNDIIEINIAARGSKCANPENADVLFVEDLSDLEGITLKETTKVITPFDRDIIISEWFNDKEITTESNK